MDLLIYKMFRKRYLQTMFSKKTERNRKIKTRINEKKLLELK